MLLPAVLNSDGITLDSQWCHCAGAGRSSAEAARSSPFLLCAQVCCFSQGGPLAFADVYVEGEG